MHGKLLNLNGNQSLQIIKIIESVTLGFRKCVFVREKREGGTWKRSRRPGLIFFRHGVSLRSSELTNSHAKDYVGWLAFYRRAGDNSPEYSKRYLKSGS